MDLKALFPRASKSFLQLHGVMAAGLPDPKPKPAPRKESLDSDQAQKTGQGRTLVCVTRYGTRLLDSDNLHGGVKPLVDALRYLGRIREDDPASIELVVRQKKVPKGKTGTQILICPIP